MKKDFLIRNGNGNKDVAFMEKDEIESALFKWWEHIDEFRSGSFDVADSNVRASWCKWFVPCYLSKLNRDWKSPQKMANDILTNKFTASDEAFALFILKHRSCYWLEDIETDIKKKKRLMSDSNTLPLEKDKKDYKRYSDEEIREFYRLQKVVTDKRKKAETGAGWDLAFQDHISKAPEKNIRQGRQSNGSAKTEEEEDDGFDVPDDSDDEEDKASGEDD